MHLARQYQTCRDAQSMDAFSLAMQVCIYVSLSNVLNVEYQIIICFSNKLYQIIRLTCRGRLFPIPDNAMQGGLSCVSYFHMNFQHLYDIFIILLLSLSPFHWLALHAE